MSRFLAIALFLVAAAGFAQQAGPGAKLSPPASAPCTLEGIVASTTSGEPIRNAMVSLVPEVWDKSSFLRYTTEADGKFIFRRAKPGRYRLQADAPGYTVQSYGQRSPNSRGMLLTLTPGCRLRDLEFRLVPGAAITGVIYDEDGAPAVGADVIALRSEFAPRRYRGSNTVSAQANDRGEYRLFGLRPGRYYVLASAWRTVARKTTMNDHRLYAFYPAAPNSAGAIPIEVRPGDEMPDVNIVLQRVTGVSVRGRLTSNVKGAPTTHISVTLVPSEGGSQVAAHHMRGAHVQGKTGEFEIREVPPGSYVLIGGANIGRSGFLARTQVEVSGAEVEGVHLALEPPVVISGRVRVEPESTLDLSRLHLFLEYFDVPLGMLSPQAQVKPDGSFKLEDVSPEMYRVHLRNLPEGYYVKSARLASADVLREDFLTVPAGSIGELEITISPNGGRIEGAVLEDGDPVPGATVVLIPDPPNRHREDLFRATETDQHGRFFLSGIPPGDFKLFAWDVMEGEAYKDPEFIERYETKGAPVHIKEGGIQREELRLIRAEEFAFK